MTALSLFKPSHISALVCKQVVACYSVLAWMHMQLLLCFAVSSFDGNRPTTQGFSVIASIVLDIVLRIRSNSMRGP